MRGTLPWVDVVMRCVLFGLVALVVMARGVDVRDPSFPARFPKSLARMLFVSQLLALQSVNVKFEFPADAGILRISSFLQTSDPDMR